jgi:predicted DNA-binding transcriptional regulator YafY
MPKSSNQKLKLLYLARIFLENTDPSHALTVKELIDELARYEIKAERKSVYDDIERLRVFGIDVQVTRDRQVRYYVGKHTFELAELRLLADAVSAAGSITEKKSGSLVKKLESLGSKYDAVQIQKCVTVAGSAKADSEEIFCNVDMIHRAIAANKRIGFRYFEWTTDKKRRLLKDGAFYSISPWALMLDRDVYYMIGYDSDVGELVRYRVDKMIELYIGKQARDGQRVFEASDIQHTNVAFGTWGGEICYVRLSCDNSLADEVVDRFGKDIIIAKGEDRFEFTAKVMLGTRFYSWILSFGNGVRVVSPTSVSEHVAALVRELAETYK